MTMRERIARAMCVANGIDPDETGYGLGNNMPKDEVYPLWWAQIKTVNAALDALMDPTDGMIKEGTAWFMSSDEVERRYAVHCFQGMIQAAKDGE